MSESRKIGCFGIIVFLIAFSMLLYACEKSADNTGTDKDISGNTEYTTGDGNSNNPGNENMGESGDIASKKIIIDPPSS